MESLVGKLFGLHSGQGRVVWQANLGRQGVLKKMFQWQLPLDPDVAPKLLLVGSSSGETHAVAVDAYNGAVLEKHVFRGNLKKVLRLYEPMSSHILRGAPLRPAMLVFHCELACQLAAVYVCPGTVAPGYRSSHMPQK